MKSTLMAMAGAVLGAAAGLIVGLISYDHAEAYESVSWDSNPGPSSAYSNLNCGWHEVCTPPADYGGSALDWANSDYAAVYFRGRGYRTASSQSLRIGTVYIGQRDSDCYNAVADIVDSLGTYRGRVNYTHSYIQVTEGYSFYIHGKNSDNYQSVWVAYSYPWTIELQEHPNCSTGGTHLHQRMSDGAWIKGSAFPNDNCSCSQGGQGNITGATKYMYFLDWES